MEELGNQRVRYQGRATPPRERFAWLVVRRPSEGLLLNESDMGGEPVASDVCLPYTVRMTIKTEQTQPSHLCRTIERQMGSRIKRISASDRFSKSPRASPIIV